MFCSDLKRRNRWCRFDVLRKILFAILRKLHIIQGPRRYKHLFGFINKYKPRLLMEIGVWNGEHALRIIKTAKKYWPAEKIEYYGFDLFEDIDEEKITEEFSKSPPTYNEVKTKLKKTGANIKLYKGNTIKVFPDIIRHLPKMDFIFIDGGHSIETIQNDWKYSKELMDDKTVVIFDDYWNREDAGCKKIIESIDRDNYSVEILMPMDKFKKDWGVLCINFVKVMKKSAV